MNKYTKLDASSNALPADADSSTPFAMVRDDSTGLVWCTGYATAEAVNHADAVRSIDSMNGAKTHGFDDWRLPTITELLTLVDYSQCDPAINGDFFPNTESDWHWTSTPAANSPEDCAWFVHFGSGDSGWDLRGNYAFVRAVRSVARASQ